MSITGFITCLICASALTLVAATSRGQTALDKKVTISIKDQSLENAFEQLAKAASVNISYGDNRALEDHLSISARDEKLGTLLDRLLTNTPFSYVSIDDKIIIRFTPDKPKAEKVVPPSGVTGKVVDEKGQPLPGASVKVKGTQLVTVTNSDGLFSFPRLPAGAILVVSFVGYQPQEVAVGGGEVLNVFLLLSSSKLDEVVIIPYGTTTQRLNTGSITKITTKDIQNQPVSNPLAALGGRVPGLIVTQLNGVPGANFKVQLEGQNALASGALKTTVNSDPLFIIDGIPFGPNNDIINQIGSAASPKSGMGISPFNSINPNDIESIEVLKDADATAIYGSRGAYGVIIITTKKGKAGKTEFNASVNSGISHVTRTMDLMNTEQYLTMRKEAFKNDNVTPTATTAPDLITWHQTKYTDWKKLLIGNTANTTDANISVSGGEKNTQFLIASGYHQESTVLPGDNADKRTSLHFNVNHYTEDHRFSILLTGGYTSDINNILQSDLTSQILLPPNYPDIIDASGNLIWQYNGTYLSGNALSYTKASYTATTNTLTSKLLSTYKIFKDFTAKISLGYNTLQLEEISTSPISSQSPQFSPLGSSTFGHNNYKSWNIEPQLEYIKNFGPHSLKVLIGGTLQSNENYSDYLFAYGFTSDNLLRSTSGATSLTSSNTYNLYKYSALFGRLNYNFLDRYIINISGRRDGSSRFGPGKQFANFGAIGAAWLFSNEKLIMNKISFLSFGKLRGSYGITGSDLIGNYQFLDTWTNNANPYAGVAGLYPTKLVNPDFSWEVNKKLSGSVDLGFLKDRLLVSATFYYNRSGNHLISSALPSQTGFTTITENFPAIVQNNGWEITISSQNLQTKSFKWATNLNVTIPKNKLVSFPGLETSAYNAAYTVGQPLNVIRAYEYTGVDPTTGLFIVKDQNNDGIYNTTDLLYLGSYDPKYYGGLQNSVSYKHFSLDVFFEFRKQLGNNYLSSIYTSSTRPGALKNQPVDLLARWQNPGDLAQYQKYTATSSSAASTAATLFATGSSGLIGDASYIRLKNLSLSYSIPDNLLKHLGMNKGQVFLRGQNILTITSYKGSDPETQSLFTLPPLKTFVAGIQFTL